MKYVSVAIGGIHRGGTRVFAFANEICRKAHVLGPYCKFILVSRSLFIAMPTLESIKPTITERYITVRNVWS